MLNQDYKEMLFALSARNVDFLVVGAYAMAAHGFPRTTGDIDIFVRAGKENADRLLQALTDFGAPLHGATIDDFSRPGTILQIGVAPVRIDIIGSIDGVSFDEAFEDHRVLTLDDVEIPCLSIEKLIKNKRATGREKDRLDAETLESSTRT